MIRSPIRRAALALLLALLPAASAHAQITVEADAYRARLGQTTVLRVAAGLDTAAVKALADRTGPDRTFDFTALGVPAWLPLPFDYVALPGPVRGSTLDVFADAGHALRLSPALLGTLPDSLRPEGGFALFRSLEADGVTTHGLFADVPLAALDSLGLIDLGAVVDDLLGELPIDPGLLLEADTLRLHLSPALRTLALPLTDGAAWQAEGTAFISIAGQQLPLSARFEGRVDAYGTLVTPDDTAPALRLRGDYVFRFLFTEVFRLRVVQYVTGGPLSGLLLLDGGGRPLLAAHGRLGGSVAAETERASAARPALGAAPHPFGDAATLHLVLPAPTHVRLRLYDVLGREVAVLLDAPLAAGRHTLPLDAALLPAGLYLARLEAGEHVVTRTLVRAR